MTRIMTNVAAINAQRNLNNTSLKMGKVLEQLSSGYRINRAADDAAGLGISEKMRAQIAGNQQALRNVQDGVSMLQTGEGAMDEVHSMLQRMRELAVQAANGTYADNGPERTSMGQEITQLASEIDRIANSTEFNGQKLLTGNLSVAVGGTSATSLVGSKLIGGPSVPATSGIKNGATLPSGSPAAVNVTAVAVANVAPGTYSFAVNGGNIEMRQGTTVIATATAANFNGSVPVAAGASGTVTFSNGMTATVANPAGNAAYTFANLGADFAGKSLQVDGLQASQLDVSAAIPQTYTFSSPGAGSLTLTGADGTTQTLSGITAMGPNETRTLQFSQLGVNVTLTAGPSGFANP
jgi:flagellin